MSKKNNQVNLGIPYSVDVKKDLAAHKGTADTDSWYVNCTFEAQGQHMGFSWHEQAISTPFGKIYFLNLFFMNGDKNMVYKIPFMGQEDEKNFASEDKLHVSSIYGGLTGDDKEMHLKLNTGNCGTDLTFKVKDVLYNGTTGYLDFFNGSYQYSFTNMEVSGKYTINNETYEISNATAWMDRQWTKKIADSDTMTFAPKTREDFNQSWLWIGMPLGEHSSISLWDAYTGDEGRHCFATILKEDGTQVNTLMEVSYEEVWISKETGSQYPKRFTINVPTEDLHLIGVSLVDNTELVHEGSGMYAAKCFCLLDGKWGDMPLHKYAFVEEVGNVCGDELLPPSER